ncbi:MAG: hypothetical protein L6416_03135, partial [Candidatus Omnitrophica bacterium]|nr:hypothetical protein [Candidatus Omnitrophota bacterium]
TDEMIKESDMILVMEPGHKRHILMRFPNAEKRVFLLKEFALENEEENPMIPDPIGMDERFYDQVALILKRSIEGLVAKLHEDRDWQ